MKNIRWHQRLNNYKKALNQLQNAISLAKERKLTELEKQGLIQSFKFTHELAWNVMRDYFYYQGNPEIRGSRDATREAFKMELIEEGNIWMEMIISRNKTSHTYDEEIANQIVENILKKYGPLFVSFDQKMTMLTEKDGKS